MIKENLTAFLKNLPKTNPFGEEVTLVGATKTRTVEEINEAIAAGLKDVGENKPQEFRDKFPLLLPCRYHFFGRLQKNKVKYLVGKAFLIQSVDSVELAQTISQISVKQGVMSDVLLEVNLGESQKGGFPIDSIIDVFGTIKTLPNLKIMGLMAVLPSADSQNAQKIPSLCLQMRKNYDILKRQSQDIRYLSMGMSADYLTAISFGSNMIRIGTAIFGKRDYKE